MSEIRDSITKNIKLYRETHGWSQRELAKKLNVGYSSVSNWELGLNSPSVELLMEMCKLFDIKIQTMYGVSETAGQKAEQMFTAYLQAPKDIRTIVETALKMNQPILARETKGEGSEQ